MAQELLKNRRKYVEIMLKNGISAYDIARFYEIRPSSVSRSLKALQLEEIETQKDMRIGDFLFEFRDKLFQSKDDEEKSKILKEYGFINIPKVYEQSQGLISYQSDDPIYTCLLEKMTAKEIAAKLGIPSCEVKRKIKSLELDEARLKKESKIYKRAKDLSSFVELRLDGFSNSEIADYLFISEYEVNKLFSIAKSLNFVSNGKEAADVEKTKIAKYLGAEGLTLDEISELTGVAENQVASIVRDLRKDSSTPMEYKSEKRRREIFKMYTQDLLTQQEIADRLGITRSTVISDLKKYKAQHPSEVDKTYLWRQRNVSEHPKAARIDKKEKVLKLLKSGVSIGASSRQLGIAYGTISKYAKEEGLDMSTPGTKTYTSRQSKIDQLKKAGYSTSQIADEMGLPEEKIQSYEKSIEKTRETRNRRAEALNLSWNGMPTTDIMLIMGRSRGVVLYDQHQTSNVLRNNEEILEYVASKKGNVIKEAAESPLEQEKAL